MDEFIKCVTALCKILNSLTNLPLKPDFFRICKLNKTSSDEIQQFMKVLHKLCCFSTTSSCSEDAHKCISSYLLREGGAVAYCLPPDVSGRQLLLCFGWLLSHGILETCIDQLVLASPLGKEMFMDHVEIASVEQPLRPSLEKPEDAQNYALVLAGQIQHNLRAISNFRQEKAKLCAQIHTETVGFKGLPHLSAGDVRLLMFPHLIPDFLSKCHSSLKILEAYARWQKKSNLFWNWMESVLSAEEAYISEKIKKEERLYKPLSESEVDHLKTFLKKLEENVKKSVMDEGEVTVGNITNMDTRRMSASKSKNSNLDRNALDREIQTLTIIFEREKQGLHKKLDSIPNSKLNHEVGMVNTVLSQFKIGI